MITAMLSILATLYVIAQVLGLPVDTIVSILAPVVTFAATALVRWIKPAIPGKWIVALIVPVLGAGVSALLALAVPETNFWGTLVVTLAATWLREVITQFKQGNEP